MQLTDGSTHIKKSHVLVLDSRSTSWNAWWDGKCPHQQIKRESKDYGIVETRWSSNNGVLHILISVSLYLIKIFNFSQTSWSPMNTWGCTYTQVRAHAHIHRFSYLSTLNQDTKWFWKACVVPNAHFPFHYPSSLPFITAVLFLDMALLDILSSLSSTSHPSFPLWVPILDVGVKASTGKQIQAAISEALIADVKSS